MLNALRLLSLIVIIVGSTLAQTSSFVYQGKLQNNGLAATGTYELQFTLFDSVSGGNQIGQAQTFPSVSVVNGIFTTELDFGLDAFPGPSRYLQIAVRTAGSQDALTPLTPRQAFTSAPYAIRSLNADTATNSLQLGGIDANQYVITDDPRLSDLRIPTPGSLFYIQNGTALQAFSQFHISGNGMADGTLSGNIVNSTTQYNISGNRVFSIAGTDNTFAGINAGTVNTGAGNSFFGRSAGQTNTTGNFNTFIGKSAGVLNSSGDDNTFVGRNAGTSNTVGNSNTLIGANANVLSNNLTNATAIGAGAIVGISNTIQLGRLNGDDTVYVPGKLVIQDIVESATVPLCINLSYTVGICPDSFSGATNISSFDSGLNLITQLKPVSFDRKNGGTRDVGLRASDVEKIEPLLVTYNKNGEAEGVKYDRIGIVLLNAVKEQQAQIEEQKRQIEQQRTIVNDLKMLVCGNNAKNKICEEK